MTPKTRFLLTAVAPQAIVAVAAMIWFAANLSRMPDPVATHFALDGTADGWSSPVMFLSLSAGFLLVMLAPPVAVAFGAMGSGRNARPMAGLMSGTTIGLALLIPATIAPQLGLADVSEFSLGAWPLIWPWPVAMVAGIAVALVTEPIASEPEQVPAAEPVELRSRDRAAWFGSASASGWLIAVFAATALVGAGVLGVTAISAAVIVPALALLALFIRVRVRIDARGISWSYFPGIRRPGLRWDDIEDVSADVIHPGDYGGWGWRKGFDGSTAILIRRGEALKIARRGKPGLWISVDDAARGAELARAYLRRG